MNREILFRGKRTDNGEWAEGYYSYSPNFLAHKIEWYKMTSFGSYQRTDAEVLPETVGQYTGLTDKNGKKIFEGDVVQTAKYGKDNGNGCNYAGRDVFQIVFEDGGYCLHNKWRRFNLRPDTGIEVIGNAADNPELIGGVGDV